MPDAQDKDKGTIRVTLFQCKMLIFVLATVAMNALVFVMFILGRMSSWVVSDDMLNARMDREGGIIEHAVAEFVHTRSGISPEFITVLLLSIGFLALLWHTLFRAEPTKPGGLEHE
jgi:hypothetical protein